MNIQNLRDTYPKLIAHMQESGYSKLYTQRLKGQITAILSSAEISHLSSYSDVYRYYVEPTSSVQSLRLRLTNLGIIERFDLRGEFPDGRTRQKIKERGYYQSLSPSFKSVIDTYRDFEVNRGSKKERTIYGESCNGASFLYDLQCAGIVTPKEITQKSVISVFLNEDGTLRRGCSFKKIIATVFKANIFTNPELFNRLISYLHFIVMHDSMLKLMQEYDTAIGKLYPNRVHFFPGRDGKCHTRYWVSVNFKKLWSQNNSSSAVPYALRHNYAIENINSWTDDGFEFNKKLHSLSKSMGHTVIESTKYYYSLVPRLATVLAEHTNEDETIPEVHYESY